MQAVIALKLAEEMPSLACDYIGADKGAYVLAKKGIHMVMAVGDFDSVTEEEMNLIRKYSDEVIQLNPIKDDSDSESALRHAITKGYDKILMIGAFGGRMDHTYYNFRLAYAFPDLLTLIDKKNKVYALTEGIYHIKKEDYSYISFFTDTKAVISLEGFEYPLSHRTITADTIYTLSNSILKEEGVLKVEQGKVLVMQAKD